MKKLLIIMCVLMNCSFLNLKAQEEVSTDSMQYYYCQIVGTGKFMSKKVTVELDFGQRSRLLSDQRLRDKDGKVITFNSMVDAMNWMGARGWEFIQAYVITVSTGMGAQNVYHWLLKKSVKKMSLAEKEVLLGDFKTKKDFKEKE